MPEIESRLTVYFEAPFWVGVYERIMDGRLEVCKVTFGAEPKDYEVYEFFLKNWGDLQFSPQVKAEAWQKEKINPKRMQRQIRKQLDNKGIETRSQQALKLQLEEKKTKRKEYSKQQKEEEKRLEFEQKQQKRKEKHRGR